MRKARQLCLNDDPLAARWFGGRVKALSLLEMSNRDFKSEHIKLHGRLCQCKDSIHRARVMSHVYYQALFKVYKEGTNECETKANTLPSLRTIERAN